MKKLFILIVTLVMVFTLTACTTKKKDEGNTTNPTNNTEKKKDPEPTLRELTCVKDFSDQMSNDVTMEQKMYMKWESNKIKTIIMYMNFELPSNLAKASDTFITTMKSTYDNMYGNRNGVKVELEKESTTEFSIIITMDYPNVSSEDKVSLGFVGSEDFNVNKTSFKNAGYVCE